MASEDTGSMPRTEAHPAPPFATGPQSARLFGPARAWSLVDDDIAGNPPDQQVPAVVAEPPSGAEASTDTLGSASVAVVDPAPAEPPAEPPATEPTAVEPAAGTEPLPAGKPRHAAATPQTVPGQFYFLRWWQLAAALVAVWGPAAGVGLGLFYWWHSAFDKTPAVFVVLVYVVVCTVGAVLMAMVPDKPLVSTLAIAVMSAVPASMVAAAVLYGHYYCQQVSPCVAGILPY